VRRFEYRVTAQVFRLKAEAYKKSNESADNNGWEKDTTKYAKVAKRETSRLFKDKSYKIVGGCFEVYKEKGSGFIEAVYLVNFGRYL